MTFFCFFFFNDTATTEIYTLSLHDALPIFPEPLDRRAHVDRAVGVPDRVLEEVPEDDLRSESTRLNSSHSQISYAVFCLKKKKNFDNKTQQEHFTPIKTKTKSNDITTTDSI